MSTGLGLGLTALMLRLLDIWGPEKIPRIEEVGLNGRLALAALIVWLICSLILGILPLRRIETRGLSRLTHGGRSPEQTLTPRLRRALITGQLTLAVLLLVGAALLSKSFWKLQDVDPGFRSRNVLVFQLVHPDAQSLGIERLQNFYESFLSGIRALPGVEAAAAGYDHPLASNWSQGFRREDRPVDDPNDRPGALFRTVTPGYFRTMGIDLLRGREFSESDRSTGPGVAIINQAMARRWFGNEEPLGKWLRIGTTQWMWGDSIPTRFEIVGVVADVRFNGPHSDSEPAFYLPFAQTPQEQMTLLVRTRGDPLALVPSVRRVLADLDGALPMIQTTSMGTLLDESIQQDRFNLVLLGGFALISLFLAVVGLWAGLNDIVSLRLPELGIRMALGAKRGQVFLLMVLDGLRPAFLGVVLGLAASFGLSRFLQGMLFQVSTLDWSVYALVPAVLIAVAALACSLPALRAARTDPLRVIREQ